MTSRRWYARDRGGVSAARIVTSIGALFALIEVVFILLHVLGANSGNGFYHFVARLAGPLALFFPGLFSFSSENVTILVNYGLAAVFWLVVTGFIARLIAR